MLVIRNSPKDCHPERSTTASKASLRAQSKDPCTLAVCGSASRRLSEAVDGPLREFPDALSRVPYTQGSFDSARSFERAPLRMTGFE